MGAGILGNPYFRKNDISYSWVGRGDWQYIRTFKVSKEVLKMDKILLICEGLDSIATVTINDRVVGKSDNMFVRYIFDIKSVVKDTNVIAVDFKSPVQYGEEKANASEYKVPPDCPPYYFHGECHRNMVRKMQCAFSWDWGPAFVTMGIWKDIYIQATDGMIITDVTTETSKVNDTWKLHMDIFTRSSDKIAENGLLEIAIQGTDVEVTRDVKLNKGLQTLSEIYDIPKDDTFLLSRETVKGHTKTQRLSFYFRINNHPIFLKGSNWVPADSFPERVTKDRLRNYLQSAVDANMNCLRVWGGGIYESDYFYDLADEFGILIWQDFMFACALYPVDEDFLSSVKEEVTYQVRRLKNHPSVFAYSGNNENEAAIAGSWWPGVFRNKILMSDYVKLYVDTILTIVKETDPTRPYMTSSPSNGIASAMEGGLSSNPGNTRYGDSKTPKRAKAASLQGIVQAIAMRTETEHYRRWQSEINEYGEGKTMGALYWMFADIWQAPSWSSIEYGGKWKMLHYYAIHFFSPVLISPFISNHESTDHLQVYIVVDELSEFQRTKLQDGNNFPNLDNRHELPAMLGNTLFPSWKKQSLLDILKDKLEERNEVLSLFSGTVYMRVYSWDSLDTKYTEQLEFKLFKPSELIYKISVQNLVLKSGCGAPGNCFVVLYIGDINNGHSTWYPLTTFKDAIGLREPDLKVELIKTTEDDNVFELQLRTDAVAPFVWLEARGIKGRFSDNGFLMFLPQKTILFYAWETTDADILKERVTIKSLMDIYN
ncbi:beta-mannosidase-like [Ruditapes philippinarum]|uniref:beta-mannosidase-like n=1 Tax=Ruditapes philippinarum TaxID=129788 RepID=UPI00295BF5F6|nr:beta-mannosidase-like [Ruditapes philippinarum]